MSQKSSREKFAQFIDEASFRGSLLRRFRRRHSPAHALSMAEDGRGVDPATSNITVAVDYWSEGGDQLDRIHSAARKMGRAIGSKLADTPAADQHVSTINVPTGVYNSVKCEVHIQCYLAECQQR